MPKILFVYEKNKDQFAIAFKLPNLFIKNLQIEEGR